MSFTQNLRSYLAFFDGTKREFSEVEHLFDAIYDDNYVQMDGETLNRQQMKKIHQGCLERASRATAIRVESIAPDSVEFQFRMANDNFDVIIHSLGKIKNGKLIKDKRVTSEMDSLEDLLRARTYLLEHHDIEELVHQLEEYIKVHNSDQSTLMDMETVFERIFHDDFEGKFEGHGSGLRKDDAKRIVFKNFVEKARIQFERIEVVDPSHLDIIIRKENEWRRHHLLTVKDGKMLKVETLGDPEDQPKVTFDLESSSPVSAQ